MNLLVRNLDDKVHAEVKRMAEAHQRSVNQELLVLIQEGLEREAHRARVATFKGPVKPSKPIPPDFAVRVIREARDAE